MTEENE